MTKLNLLLISIYTLASCITGDTTATALRRRLEPVSENTETETETETETQPKGRPKMHTFFTPVSNSPDTSLLDVWKKSWSDAGWEPVVLTLEDARKHPDYRRFIEAFESAEYKLKDYDRMCFLRWLAMAMSGGGWMSDYDTLPLYARSSIDGHELPNGGRFTCYSRHVPNIVSGSEEEWHRMSQLLFFSYKLHPDVFWSDMLALLEVHDYLDGYVYQKDSISLEKVYLDELQGGKGIERPHALAKKCDIMKGMRAIHFSHADCHIVGFCDNDRSRAQAWIDAWNEKCNGGVVTMK